MILFNNDTLDNKLYFRKDIVEIDIIHHEYLEFKTMRLYVDIEGRTIYKRLNVSCLSISHLIFSFDQHMT
jgi:hypothetical protein